jgi:hypothetical protein
LTGLQFIIAFVPNGKDAWRNSAADEAIKREFALVNRFRGTRSTCGSEGGLGNLPVYDATGTFVTN